MYGQSLTCDQTQDSRDKTRVHQQSGIWNLKNKVYKKKRDNAGNKNW